MHTHTPEVSVAAAIPKGKGFWARHFPRNHSVVVFYANVLSYIFLLSISTATTAQDHHDITYT